SLFMPIHWSDETASAARVGDLVAPWTDPHSGQPEAKATPAAIAPASFPLQGLVRTRAAATLPSGTWWTRVTTAAGAEYRLATHNGALTWHDFAYRTLAVDARLAERFDGSGYRAAAFVDGEMTGYLWIGPAPLSGALALSAADVGDGEQPALKIAPESEYISEPIVCACFQVALSAVRAA